MSRTTPLRLGELRLSRSRDGSPESLKQKQAVRRLVIVRRQAQCIRPIWSGPRWANVADACHAECAETQYNHGDWSHDPQANSNSPNSTIPKHINIKSRTEISHFFVGSCKHCAHSTDGEIAILPAWFLEGHRSFRFQRSCHSHWRPMKLGNLAVSFGEVTSRYLTPLCQTNALFNLRCPTTRSSLLCDRSTIPPSLSSCCKGVGTTRGLRNPS